MKSAALMISISWVAITCCGGAALGKDRNDAADDCALVAGIVSNMVAKEQRNLAEAFEEDPTLEADYKRYVEGCKTDREACRRTLGFLKSYKVFAEGLVCE